MSADPKDAAPRPEALPGGRERLDIADFAVRKESYADSPWRVVHVPSGRTVTIPKTVENADGKIVSYRGPACFARKRDALAWMASDLADLVMACNVAAALAAVERAS